jgi:hypothetical protein
VCTQGARYDERFAFGDDVGDYEFGACCPGHPVVHAAGGNDVAFAEFHDPVGLAGNLDCYLARNDITRFDVSVRMSAVLFMVRKLDGDDERFVV